MNEGEETTYYDILRVLPNATARQIDAMFRALAHDVHPDKNPAPDANARFAELKAAFDVLSDPERRRAYDAELQAKVSAKRKRSTNSARQRSGRRPPTPDAADRSRHASSPQGGVSGRASEGPQRQRWYDDGRQWTRAEEGHAGGSASGSADERDDRTRSDATDASRASDESPNGDQRQRAGQSRSHARTDGAGESSRDPSAWIPFVLLAGVLLLLVFGRGQVAGEHAQTLSLPVATNGLTAAPVATPLRAATSSTPITPASTAAPAAAPVVASQETTAPPTSTVPVATPTVAISGPSLRLVSASVRSGDPIGVSWSGIVAPSVSDWVGLAPSGSRDGDYVVRFDTGGLATGYQEIVGVAAGSWEVRFWSISAGQVVARAGVTVFAAPGASAALPPVQTPPPALPPSVAASPNTVTVGQSFNVIFSNFRGSPNGTYVGSVDPLGRWSPATTSPYDSFTITTDPYAVGFSFPVVQNYTRGVQTLRFYVGGVTYDVAVTLR